MDPPTSPVLVAGGDSGGDVEGILPVDPPTSPVLVADGGGDDVKVIRGVFQSITPVFLPTPARVMEEIAKLEEREQIEADHILAEELDHDERKAVAVRLPLQEQLSKDYALAVQLRLAELQSYDGGFHGEETSTVHIVRWLGMGAILQQEHRGGRV